MTFPFPIIVRALVQRVILAATGTVVSNEVWTNGAGTAFDGNYANADANGARVAGAGFHYIGKDWGAGVTKLLSGIKTWGHTDTGYDQSGGTAATVEFIVVGNTSNDPTTGVTLYTAATFTDANGTQPKEYLTGFNTAVAYRYHWLGIRTGVTGASIGELEFYEDT